MTQPNPFSDKPNPYSSPQAPAGQPPFFPPPPGTGQFAPCPSCSNVYAAKQGFTWWGGALGPWLFTHVKCYRCGTTYNGKTGQSNNTAIAIYLIVSLVIGAILAVALVLGGILK